MQKWCVVAMALMTMCLAGCGQADIDLTYPTGADDVIIQATSAGGYVPDAYIQSYIPEFRLYGDGRVIWAEWRDGRTSVWQGRLSRAEITSLLGWVEDTGFFRLKNQYMPKNPPTDLPNDCVRVSLTNIQKTVCEYHSGAPKAFWEVYGQLRSGAKVPNSQPYEPDLGWVTVEEITWGEAGDSVAWPDTLSPRPSDMGEGAWVEGEMLDFLWQGRLEQGPWMVYGDGDERFGLVLQVPGLMPEAPEGPE